MLDRLAEVDYRPDQRLVRALDSLFILHAEHTSTTSTAGLRHLASAGVDPYTAVAGAAGALFGERRGCVGRGLPERAGARTRNNG